LSKAKATFDPVAIASVALASVKLLDQSQWLRIMTAALTAIRDRKEWPKGDPVMSEIQSVAFGIVKYNAMLLGELAVGSDKEEIEQYLGRLRSLVKGVWELLEVTADALEKRADQEEPS
jgi:hypothetical protein